MNYIDIDQVADQVKHLLWSFNSIDISVNQIKIFMLYLLRTLTGSFMCKMNGYVPIENKDCEWNFNGNSFNGKIILNRSLPGFAIRINFYSMALDYEICNIRIKQLIDKILFKIKDNRNIIYNTDQYLCPISDEDYELYSIIMLTIFQYLSTKIINKKENVYLIDFCRDDYIKSIIPNKRRTCFIIYYDGIAISENSTISSIIIERIKRKEIDDYMNTDTKGISNSEIDTILELL